MDRVAMSGSHVAGTLAVSRPACATRPGSARCAYGHPTPSLPSIGRRAGLGVRLGQGAFRIPHMPNGGAASNQSASQRLIWAISASWS